MLSGASNLAKRLERLVAVNRNGKESGQGTEDGVI